MRPTALEIAQHVARGDTTAEAVVGAAVEAAHNDTTNAFTAIDEHALDRAREVDAAVSNGHSIGPLVGVPIAVKDLIDHAGRVTTAGSSFYRHRAERTAPALERLERAGAVVVGRTGLHEFAFGFTSENPWFGPVHNPWDRRLSPGGSSGGSAAAVAAGIVPLAVGTDTGGSIRVPAALCAVAGLKVTHGRIPLVGVFPLAPSLDTVGPIAGSLDDLAVAAMVMSGPDDRDPTSRDLDWSPGPIEPLGRLELVVPRRWIDDAPMDGVVADAFQAFLDGAARAGASVTERDLDEIRPSRHIAGVLGPEVAEVHRAWRRAGEPYGADVGARIDAALDLTPDQVAEAARWREAVTAATRAATEDGSLLVTPTVPHLDKVIGVEEIAGHRHRAVLSWFTAVVNQTGAPALSVPLAGTGRTPSLQLIGGLGTEPALVAAARLLAEAGLVDAGRWSSDNDAG